MEKKIVFGKWEAITILINLLCTKIFLNFPRKMAEDAGTAGWILVLYTAGLAFLGFFIITKLYSRFEGKDLIDIGEYWGGAVVRIITGLTIIGFLCYLAAIYLRTFSESMKVVSLPVSPISFVSMFFITGIIAGAYFGMEAIARVHSIAVPIIATGFMIIMIAVFSYADLRNLLPILGNGAGSIFIWGAADVSNFSELLVLLLLIPFIKTQSNFKKVGYSALGFSTFFLLISTVVYSSIISYPASLERVIPIFHLSRLINYGRFFQRIESIFVIIWSAAALLYLTIIFYLILYVFKKTFKLEFYKPLILPFAILIFYFSFLPENLMTAISIETGIFREWSWAVAFGMSIILLSIARIVKRKRTKGKRKTA